MSAYHGELAKLASQARHVLIDFDGPICEIFAGLSSEAVADQLRSQLRASGIGIRPSAADIADPLEVFRAVVDLGDDAAHTAQELLTAIEVQAVATARPAPGSADLLAAAVQTGRTVAVVTNNSGAAVSAYLTRHHLSAQVEMIVGRDSPDAALMKPSPYRVREAVSLLDTEGSQCAFIGDSVTDVLAGRLAGVPVIGYANRPGKVSALTDAGADAVTTRLAAITAAFRAAPRIALPN